MKNFFGGGGKFEKILEKMDWLKVINYWQNEVRHK